MTGGIPRTADFPKGFASILKKRHTIIRHIRSFFDQRGYVEVETPVRVRCPGFDPYIDALSAGKGFYLSPSPELQMKRLLGLGFNRIYQITRAFRAEEEGAYHSTEFTILEWYRTETDYMGILQETEELFLWLITHAGVSREREWKLPFPRFTVAEVYQQQAGWNPCRSWDENRYFMDWVEKIDPWLHTKQGIFLLDFPAPLASLAKISSHDHKICERFEVFFEGIEIGNAFTELTDPAEHEIRFKRAQEMRAASGKEVYPEDANFMDFIAHQGMPSAAGIAIGVDRLVMALCGIRHIDEVQTFPLSRL